MNSDALANPRLYLPWSEARPLIQTGDILALRANGVLSWLIRTAGRSQHSHVEMAQWIDEDLESVGFCELIGGRSINFEYVISAHHCRWDVFRLSDLAEIRWVDDHRVERVHTIKINKERTVRKLRHMTGQKYGWWSVWWAALRHLTPGVLPAVVNDDDQDTYPPFCSQAIARACRQAHEMTVEGKRITVDLVRYLPDWLTEPADLVRSPLVHYLFSICPDAESPPPGGGS